MKKLIVNLLVLSVLVSSCQKANDLVSIKPVDPLVAKPTASFKINNPVSGDMLLEGDILSFANQSANADSYYWDFGNGTYSTDKVPVNISFSPCGHTYTITLTVKNKSGDVAAYSQTFTILCSGKHTANGG